MYLIHSLIGRHLHDSIMIIIIVVIIIVITKCSVLSP